MYLHLPVQNDSVGERPAGQPERSQPAACKCQYAHCPRGGRAHGGGPAGLCSAQYHAGHLQPCLRQKQTPRGAETQQGDGTVRKAERVSPINGLCCAG